MKVMLGKMTDNAMTDSQLRQFNSAVERAAVSKVPQEKKWRSDLCDDCCLACEAWVENGGRCCGAEHMALHDEAMQAIEVITELCDGSIFVTENEQLSRVSEAVSWLDPSLENPHLDNPDEALEALLQLERQLEETVMGRREAVIPVPRDEPNAAEITFSECNPWFDSKALIDAIKRLFETALKN